jgi:hypothetical protein
MLNIIGRWLGATLVLAVLVTMFAAMVRAVDVEPAPDLLWWALLSHALTAACAIALTAGTPLSRRALTATVFVVRLGSAT